MTKVDEIKEKDFAKAIQNYLKSRPEVSAPPGAFTTKQAKKIMGYGKEKTLNILHDMADRGRRTDRWGDTYPTKGWQLVNGKEPE
jgi:hypothetical protein